MGTLNAKSRKETQLAAAFLLWPCIIFSMSSELLKFDVCRQKKAERKKVVPWYHRGPSNQELIHFNGIIVKPRQNIGKHTSSQDFVIGQRDYSSAAPCTNVQSFFDKLPNGQRRNIRHGRFVGALGFELAS